MTAAEHDLRDRLAALTAERYNGGGFRSVGPVPPVDHGIVAANLELDQARRRLELSRATDHHERRHRAAS